MTPLWALEAAAWFWEAAGARERPGRGPARAETSPAFPRDLRQAVAFALPLAIVDLPQLRVGGVERWLEAHGAAGGVGAPDRALRGGLLVRDGAGIVFLDATDRDDERRFSLAHEVAHYLLEYALPRARAVHHLGRPILEVLDGQRRAAPTERLHAALRGVELAPILHLLDRSPHGDLLDARVTAAERDADTLAFELLAPADHVLPYLRAGLAGHELVNVLAAHFGLPLAAAHAYARQLCPEAPGRDPLLDLRDVSNFGEPRGTYETG